MTGTMINFEAEIRGYRPPYRWRLLQFKNGSSSKSPVKVKSDGGPDVEVGDEADSFQEACFAAHEAAKIAYDAWLQENQKEIVPVLTGAVRLPRHDEDEISVAEPRRELREETSKPEAPPWAAKPLPSGAPRPSPQEAVD